MKNLDRRSFVISAVAMLPSTGLLQTNPDAGSRSPVKVAAGEDRYGNHHTLGVSATDFKVGTLDSRGNLFVMQHTNKKRGGPPRHLHHVEDEWFYVIEGEYIVEVGAERFELKAGDCVLAPKEIPHAWAFVGASAGKMILAYTPAGKMEAFFTERTSTAYTADAERYRAYGLELTGGPIKIE